MQAIARFSTTARTTLRNYAFFCTNVNSLSILDSQYHQKGRLPLKRSKMIERLLKDVNPQLDSKIDEIQLQRKELIKKRINITSIEQYQRLKEKGTHMEEYFKRYEEFVNIFEKCQLNNQWIFKVIGWYNVTKYYKPLIERLLDSSKEQTEHLLDSLAWMKYKWQNAYGLIDDNLRENRKIEKFYRHLSTDLQIEQLKKLQSIIIAPLTMSKRKFYELYALGNVQTYLKSIRHEDEEGISNAIWLFERCIISMVDHDFLISKLEKYLLTNKLKLNEQNIERLINIYTLKGRINKNIYNEYIKPYIVKQKMKDIPNIIEAIKFIVCSECQDNQTLKNLYELIEINYQYGKLTHSRYKYQLHLFTHYLRIKGYSIKLNPILQKQLTDFCKQRAEGRSSVDKLVYDNKVIRANIAKNKVKYVSECLNINKSSLNEYDSTSRSQFQTSFKYKLLQLNLQEMKIYEKPIFCCFELDFCLSRESANELTDVQIEGMQYVFTSGRLIRSREIRDEMLLHYGFKINHIDYNSFKSKNRISEEQILMNKRIFFDHN